MPNTYQRLPLGALIRNENSNIFYLVIKVVKNIKNDAYYLCCVFDPSLTDQTQPLTFHFIIGDEKAYKFTVLNTNTKPKKDGSLCHKLTYIDPKEAAKLQYNEEFFLRYLTACQFFKQEKELFEVSTVSKEALTVDLLRKPTWLERILFKPSYLVFTITWLELLVDYLPFIQDNLDEELYINTVQKRCYFCSDNNS